MKFNLNDIVYHKDYDNEIFTVLGITKEKILLEGKYSSTSERKRWVDYIKKYKEQQYKVNVKTEKIDINEF